MKRKVEMSKGKLPLPEECPRCESTDLRIDNYEGLECMNCGCWFDTEPNGTVVWARQNRPRELE